MTQEKEPLPEEQYSDAVHLETTESATIRMESDLIRAELSTYRDESLQCGIDITRDGSFIAISAGTVNQEEKPHFYAWCEVTPEQARELADAMHQAADDAEIALQAGESEPEDSRTFLQKLVGRTQ